MSRYTRYVPTLLLLLTFLTACGDENEPLPLPFEGEAPTVEITSSPEATTSLREAAFEFRCVYATCAFECKLDDEAFEACESPISYDALSRGEHRFEVVATNQEGLQSEPATRTWEIVADPPEVVNLEGPPATTNSPLATFTFECSKENCTYTCKLDDGDFELCSSGVTYSALSEGSHRFTVRARDEAGTAGPPVEYSWRVQFDSPDIPALLNLEGPDALTNETDATFTFQCSLPGCSFECSLDGAGFESCASGETYEALSDGDHDFAVRPISSEGAVGPSEEWSWTIDTTAPEVTNLEGPDALVNQTDAAFSFQCSKTNCTFECSLNGADFESCESGDVFQIAEDGDQTFSVRATDDLGNASESSTYEWTVDTTAPQAEISSGPDALTNQTAATFEFQCNESACTFECSLGGSAFEACQSGDTFDDLPSGAQEFSLRATDQAGNTGDAIEYTWEIDTDSPAIINLGGTSGSTNQPGVSFTFQCSKPDCTFVCQLSSAADGLAAGPQTCTSPQEYLVEDDGDYTFEVVPTDALGNQGTAVTRSFTVDREEPLVTGLSGPDALTNSTSAALTFGCSKADCDFFCRLSSSADVIPPEVSCESGVEYENLSDDDYTFEVRAVDALGNEGPPSSTGWTIDTTGPTTEIAHSPPSLTNQSDATFEFACPDASETCSFECSLNSAAFASCTSPITYTDLADGDHTFEVRGLDALDNVGSTVAHTWTIDTEAPVVVFTQTPDPSSYETTAHFAFECNDETCASFECALDFDINSGAGIPGEWESCASPYQTAQLQAGEYEFRVRGTDEAGNQGVATAAWEVLSIEWLELSSGSYHSCGIDDQNQLYCWGEGITGKLGLGDVNNTSRPTLVGVESDWQLVSAGRNHTCAIRSGELYCWGSGSNGALGLGDDSQQVTPQRVGVNADWTTVATGDNHTCGIRSGELYCWGRGDNGQLGIGTAPSWNAPETTPVQVGTDTDWTAISAGERHTCGIRSGELYCWGSNNNGELGLTSYIDQLAPTRVETSTGWTHIELGHQHSCGIDQGELYCWGNENGGRLGLTAAIYTHYPQQVGDAADWADISAGVAHTCGLRGDTLYCWGRSTSGQLGTGNTDTAFTPVEIAAGEPFTTVSAGHDHTCAVTEGTMTCWGDNALGQIGMGGFGDQRLTPEKIRDQGFDHLSNSNFHSCGIDDGRLYCWGWGNNGEVGQGQSSSAVAPVQVGAHEDWTTVSAGGLHTCGLRDGELYCWGAGLNGRLGQGDDDNSSYNTPQPVGTDQDWSMLSAGASHTCAIQNGELYCWGNGFRGQLGQGNTDHLSAPTRVGPHSDWQTVSAGDSYTCGLRGGELYCWGQSSDKLGLGSTSSHQLTPARVGSAQNWSSIATGSSHTCGLQDGELYCWGNGFYGYLGLGDTSSRSTPARVGTDADWTHIATGDRHTCAIRSGELYCWGRGYFGELGIDTLAQVESPTRVGTDQDWTHIAAGHRITVAQRANGSVYTWGSNEDGRLGNGLAFFLLSRCGIVP